MFRQVTRRKSDVQEPLAVARALADENRLRALMPLGRRELCVCQLVEPFELIRKAGPS